MDVGLNDALREAHAHDDGPSWARVAQAHLRAGELELAAVAARRALMRGVDTMPLLDATTPAVNALSARAIDLEGTQRDELARGHSMAWSPQGGVLIGASGDGRLLRVDLVGQRRRALAGKRRVELLAVALEAPTALVRREGKLWCVDLETGAFVGGSIELRGGVRSAALLTRQGVAVVAQGDRVVAFDLRRPRHPVFELTCRFPDVDVGGTVAYVDGTRVAVHAPLEASPRLQLQFPLHYSATPCGLRTVVKGSHETRLLAEDGSLLGRLTVRFKQSPSPCPSGRLVAWWDHDVRPGPQELVVADLVSGQQRRFETPGVPAILIWSPSGRRLAVVTSSTSVLLVEPSPS